MNGTGTELDPSSAIQEQSDLLANIDVAVERLCALCEHHQFDGYLINFESPLHGGRQQVAAFAELLATLSICLKQRVGEQALVICYDALDEEGRVCYQNALTPANQACFDACDGLFTNYWWGAAQLQQSTALAGPTRQHDVYVGVDVFARNTTYGAGDGCAVPCRAARAAGLSLALFAPGWSIECGAASKCERDEDAARCDMGFWNALGLRSLYRS